MVRVFFQSAFCMFEGTCIPQGWRRALPWERRPHFLSMSLYPHIFATCHHDHTECFIRWMSSLNSESNGSVATKEGLRNGTERAFRRMRKTGNERGLWLLCERQSVQERGLHGNKLCPIYTLLRYVGLADIYTPPTPTSPLHPTPPFSLHLFVPVSVSDQAMDTWGVCHRCLGAI